MNIFTGIYQLITSPSGFFALLCLVVLSVLSWHLGVAWVTAAATAWSAFFAIIPAALGYFEHKETLMQMQQQASQPVPVVTVPMTTTALPPTGPVIPVPTPADPGSTTTTVTVSAPVPLSMNLPNRGQL